MKAINLNNTLYDVEAIIFYLGIFYMNLGKNVIIFCEIFFIKETSNINII